MKTILRKRNTIHYHDSEIADVFKNSPMKYFGSVAANMSGDFAALEIRVMAQLVERVKRQAKRIKKEQNVTHTEALEVAAKNEGFQNYKHLLNTKEKGIK